jgi:predicted metal-dependent hydrolase
MSSAAPALTAEDQADYEEGWQLFSAGRYWHAHESWERLWLRRKGCAELRLFVQGLIQLTAGCHLAVEKRRAVGASKNLDKAAAKLAQLPPRYLDVDVRALLFALAALRAELERLGQSRLSELSFVFPVERVRVR